MQDVLNLLIDLLNIESIDFVIFKYIYIYSKKKIFMFLVMFKYFIYNWTNKNYINFNELSVKLVILGSFFRI